MMKMTRLMIVLALLGAVTCAFAQLPGDPPWRQGAERFSGRDGVIYADDNPFLLIYDFTWSADKDARFYEFSEDWGGTASHEQVPAYDAAAAHHVYLGWAGSVAHDGAYLREHPEAAMLLADGSRARNAQVCFLNPDYREYLGANLTELATGMRDKPFNMGYYPQDEFAYRENGCYCEICRQRFRERLQESYGTIAALNEAWGTNHADFAAIQPPEAFEKSRAFCDWQEFRRWSQLDFAKFVYDTLKANDPEHVVIWSLPFWGSWIGGAAWWDFPEVSDVLMRHGIGYHTGIYRFTLMRDVAEWSGVPGNSLGMPPDFNPGYAQMSYIMDGPRTGLSHVCFAGAPDPTYQGVADSNDNYRRREPMYTVSRAINDQMYQLGDIYLLSKQRDPQVGVYASDRTLLVNGIGTRELNGLLLMLHDLNVDFRIFSEHNLGDLSRFPAIIVADCSRVVSDEIAQQFREYVAGGGNLIFQDGAFAADWYNQDVGNPGHGFDEVIGSTEGENAIVTAAVSFDAAETGLEDLPPVAPVTKDRATAVRQPTTATVIGTLPEGKAVVTLGDYGEGSVLYIGADLGSIYYSSWTEGYRDVMETDDRAQALDDNAYGYDFRPQTSASVEPMRGTKAWAQLIRSYLRSCGVGDNVVIDGYTEGVGVLKTKSFRTGDSYWVGFANRLVNPGLKHIETPPEELHQRLSDLQVRVRLDDGTAPAMAWVLPNQRRTDEGRTATTQVLPVSITEADGARWATFTLPELLDFATVALMPAGERAAVVGMTTSRQTLTAGESITATATITNTSGAAISGTVRPGIEAGLAYAGQPARFELGPGESSSHDFELSAPAGTEPDFYQVNMFAQIDGGAEAVSPSLEVQLLQDIVIAGETERTIFPLGHLEPVMPVVVQVNTVASSDLSVEVELPEGFGAEPMSFDLGDLHNGQEREVQFRFTSADDTPRVAEGLVKVVGTLRGEPFTYSEPIRLAVGTVIYRKQEGYKTHASMSPDKMELLAMENSNILATFIEGNGVVHDLILRDTNTDHLIPSPYPFGWVWYAFGAGWRVEEISEAGDRVWARVVGKHPVDGTPLVMTWSLNEGDNHITIDIDTGEAGPVSSAFYMMSRIGLDGVGERSIWPTADGLQELKWRGGRRDVPVTDLSEGWMAVQDDVTGQTFGCLFDFPTLQSVSVRPGDNNFNYMVFQPNPEVPIGDITFALSATSGGVERVQELYQKLGFQWSH